MSRIADTMMIRHDASDGGWLEYQPPGARTQALWREIAIGLGIAAIGIFLTLYVIHAGVAQPRVIHHAPGFVAPLHGDPAAAAGPARP